MCTRDGLVELSYNAGLSSNKLYQSSSIINKSYIDSKTNCSAKLTQDNLSFRKLQKNSMKVVIIGKS